MQTMASPIRLSLALIVTQSMHELYIKASDNVIAN